MHTDHDPVDPEELLNLGYEHRDVRPKPMAWAAFWLFAFTIGSGLLGALFIRIWNVVPEVPVEQRRFGEGKEVRPPPETPIIQNNSDNTADIAALRAKEAKDLTTRGQLKDGSYRIPVDMAIQDILKEGLPKTGTLPVTHPTVTPQGQVINPVPNPPMATSTAPAGSVVVPDAGMPLPPAPAKKPPAATGAKKKS